MFSFHGYNEVHGQNGYEEKICCHNLSNSNARCSFFDNREINNLSFFFNLFLFTPMIGWNLTHIFGRVFKNEFRSVNHQNQLSFNQF